MRVILLYIALVGLPIIGVAGVLQLGRDLRPPVSVSGTWAVRITSPVSHGTECTLRQAGGDRLQLNISQSGRWLTVSLSNADRVVASELVGAIDGQAIIAGASDRASMGSATAFPMALRAKLEGKGGTDRLVGLLSLTCCRSQTEFSFDASRNQKTQHLSGVH